MKKSLLGLLIALITFAGGIAAERFYQFKQMIIAVRPAVEEIKVEEIKKDEVSSFRAGRWEEAKTDELNKEPEIQGIYGWFSLDDYGKMREVSTIRLSGDNIGKNGRPNGKINLSSGIYTTLSDDWDEGFADEDWTKFDGKTVKFQTKKLKGITYSFEGSFFKNKTSGEEGEKLLRGTLRKYVKGKKVAEVSGDFAYYEPRCLH